VATQYNKKENKIKLLRISTWLVRPS
jgi:hypothetical protein